MKNVVSTGKDDFYRQMFRLTFPIIIQNLLSAAVNSADVIMLNYVGQSAISAVSLAASYSNILFMVYYGLGTGASLLCAQYFGQNNLQAIHAIEGIALRFSIAISGVVALIAFTMPNRMMLIFTSDPELFMLGRDRSLSCNSAKYRTGNHQYGIKYACFCFKYYFKCGLYFWFIWTSKTRSSRCCHCNCFFSTNRTNCLHHCFFSE